MSERDPEINTKSTLLALPVSPISVNRCWQGRRFKTKEYDSWRKFAYYSLLPRVRYCWPEKSFFIVKYRFFVKNFLKIDVDNLIKPIQDALVEAGVIPDDRMIIKIEAEKIKCKKEETEWIEIYIKSYIP